jgi:hypothetical protein
MDTLKYIATLKANKVTLAEQYPQGCCLVVSVDNLEHNSVAGHICEVPTGQAARLLTESTHRLATKEETAAFRKEHDAKRNETLNTQAALEASRRQIAALLQAQASVIQTAADVGQKGRKE